MYEKRVDFYSKDHSKEPEDLSVSHWPSSMKLNKESFKGQLSDTEHSESDDFSLKYDSSLFSYSYNSFKFSFK